MGCGLLFCCQRFIFLTPLTPVTTCKIIDSLYCNIIAVSPLISVRLTLSNPSLLLNPASYQGRTTSQPSDLTGPCSNTAPPVPSPSHLVSPSPQLKFGSKNFINFVLKAVIWCGVFFFQSKDSDLSSKYLRLKLETKSRQWREDSRCNFTTRVIIKTGCGELTN